MDYLSAASSPWLMASLAILPGLGLVVFIGLSIYRLTLHPYLKYSGPLLAKLTSWYSVYHTTYYTGDIVRYAPNRLLINTQPALKAIYGHGANGLSESQIRSMDVELRRGASLFAECLDEAEDRFESQTARPTTTGSDDRWSAAKNMAEWCDFFTFDAMSQFVFGTSYHLLDSADNHWIIDGVLGQLRRISFLTQLRELEDMKLNKVLFPAARRKIIRFTKGNDSKNDLFGKLLAAKDPETGEALSHRQLWAESNTLIIAGSDTSSTGMAAVFFYLSRNPSAYDRVTKEVRRAFPTPAAVCQGPKLSSCVYLRACIQEALRLAPAVSGASWREVLPGDLKIKIDGDTDFRPERWIPEESGEETVRLAKAAFVTFSIGPRNCVGMGLAMIEMALAMAAVISRYDFRRADGAAGEVGEGKGVFEGQFQTFWAFTSFKDGPMIQFRPCKC
ncbi:cytochrome P450 [Aspergillus desertorum]